MMGNLHKTLLCNVGNRGRGKKKLVHCILSDKVLRWHCSIAEPNEVECDPSGSVFFCNVPSTHCAVVCLTFGNSFSELFFLLLISNSKQPLNDENPRIPLQWKATQRELWELEHYKPGTLRKYSPVSICRSCTNVRYIPKKHLWLLATAEEPSLFSGPRLRWKHVFVHFLCLRK